MITTLFTSAGPNMRIALPWGRGVWVYNAYSSYFLPQVNQEHGCCYIPFGGEEHAHVEYQVTGGREPVILSPGTRHRQDEAQALSALARIPSMNKDQLIQLCCVLYFRWK